MMPFLFFLRSGILILKENDFMEDLLNKMKSIKDAIGTNTLSELKFVESPFLPDNVVVVSSNLFNQLKIETKQKGDFGSVCYRTACSNVSAEWYNFSTKKYYCQSCASLINDNNKKDAMRMFGHDLCLHGKVL